MPRRLYFWACLLWAITVVSTGCFMAPSARLPKASGSLTVKTTLPATFSQNKGGVTLWLTLVQDARHLQYPLPLMDNTVSFSVDALTVGMWEATLQLIDGDEDVLYEAREQIAITEDDTTVTALKLVPNAGSVEIYIDISDHPEAQAISQARLNLDGGGYSTVKREADETTLYIVKEVQPKSYDYRIALYNSAERPEILYNSPWESLTVRPGKVTTVHWSVTSGALELIGHITPLPQTPHHFQVRITEDNTARFTWESNDDTTTGYRIYQRQEPFGPYRLVSELPPTATHWDMTVDVDTIANGPFVITAFSDDGLESPRSEPITLHMPKGTE